MTENNFLSPRPLDHVVLPTLSLSVARSRLSALGFTVAATSVHPFGTENACVFLSDGTFLEPLAVNHRETALEASLTGNQFTAKDTAFRFRRGQEGLSALVMGTDNALQDHEQFLATGISGGDVLTFSRSFINPDGKQDSMDFHLTFASDMRAPDFFGITCERVNVPKTDRSALTKHQNSVTSMRSVILVEENPTDFHYFFQDFLNTRLVSSHSFGIDLKTGNATISIVTPEGFEALYGVPVQHNERGVLGQGIKFAVKDGDVLKAVLSTHNIAFFEHGKRIIVDKSIGQGAIFIFEAE
jgi:hypothetical protein